MSELPFTTPPQTPMSPARIPSWLRRLLGIPLEQKVLGANFMVLVIASIVLLSPLNGGRMLVADSVVLLGAIAVGAAISYFLVKLALKPVKTLEQIARKVSMGRVSERVPPSLIADRDLAHLANTINDMLDKLAAGRKRMAKLAADVVYAQEQERAEVARDLQDSVAQSLAAATFQIAAAANEESAKDVRPQLASVRELLRGCLEDIRSVSRSLHPRVADDLGLPTALQSLADLTRQRALIDVKVDINLDGSTLSQGLSTTFYRIAQEALRNVELYEDAGNATISLSARSGLVALEVVDDGCAPEGAKERARRSAIMTRMQERLSLAGGDLHIYSAGDGGMRVVATASLETEGAAA